MIVFDEAHCVCTWENTFRPGYLKCNMFKRVFVECPILLLSASATPTVQDELTELLSIDDVKIVRDTFDRPNLFYSTSLKTKNTLNDIAKLIDLSSCNLVYCNTQENTEYSLYNQL